MITNIFKELKESKQMKDLALKTYNAAATRMNNGIIEAFNKAWDSQKDKILGDEAYQRAYDTLFDKIWSQEIKKATTKFTTDQIKKAFGLFKIIIK